MTDILSRLSAAIGPSRELDAEICPYPTQLWEGDINDWLYEVPGHEGRAWDRVPRYTESIDAAMTLYKNRPALVSTNPIEVCIEALKQWT